MKLSGNWRRRRKFANYRLPGNNLMLYSGITVWEALSRAFSIFAEAGLDNPCQEAQILFSRVLGWDKLKLFLESSALLSPMQAARLWEAINRRAKGEPLAYITGRREFYSLEFTVNPAVLIPRPESEFLIDAALAWAERSGYCQGEGLLAIDLGTGSGNLAITLALKWPQAGFFAVDISTKALAVAKENAFRHGVLDKISWHCGDYFTALSPLVPPPKFNVVLSNPPYISRDDLAWLPQTVKGYEPLMALDGGVDGLEGYRNLFSGFSRHLLSPGMVAVEIGVGQHSDVINLFKVTGLFQKVEVSYDYQGIPRVVTGLF